MAAGLSSSDMSATWGVDGLDRDQGGAEVAHLREQAVQLSLVGHCATQGGGAVVLADESQSAEPGRPVLVEVPLDPQFVVGRRVLPRTLVHHNAANAARVRARPARWAPPARRAEGGRRITHSCTTRSAGEASIRG